MSPRRITVLASLAATALVAAAVLCLHAISSRSEMRSFLLITIDTLRPDHVGCYGCRSARTPQMDALALNGVRFAKAATACPLTTPSHATILTGVYPPRHKIRDNAGFVLASGCATLAEIFKQHGYATGAVISGAPLASEFGLNRGFDFYDDTFTSTAIAAKRTGDAHAVPKNNEKKAEETTAAALRWLKTLRGGQSFFLWVHYYDPHVAYRPPSPFREEYAENPYDGEIAYTDMCIAGLLNGMRDLGFLRDTTVVLTSDHGEGLGQHGEETHGLFLYDTTMLVPLIFHSPGRIAGGVTRPELVRTVDIAPTLLDIARIPVPPDLDGRSLLPRLGPSPDREPREAYMENYSNRINFGWSELRGIRTDRQKYIAAPTPELYDLDADPAEMKNLAPSGQGAAEMAGRLDALTKALDAGSAAAQASPGSARVLAQLRSLGYVAGGYGLSEPATDVPRPDPKDMVGVATDMLHALATARDGDVEGGISMLRRICERDKSNVSAWHWLANFCEQACYLPEAAAAYRQAVQLAPSSSALRSEMGNLLLEMGDVPAAASAFQEGIRTAPEFAPFHKGLGDVLYRSGKTDEAVAEYAQAAKLDPGYLDARLELAFVTAVMKDREDGLAQLRKLIDEHPRSIQARRVCADALRVLGRPKEAVDELHAAIGLDPEQPEPYLDLAGLLLDAGCYNDAKTPISRALQILPNSAEAYHKLGKYCFFTGNKKEAEVAYRKAILLNPRRSEFHNDLGAALHEQGRRTEAIWEYQKAVQLDDKNGDAFYNLGAALLQSKRDADGVAALRRAAALRADRTPMVIGLLKQLLRLEPNNAAAKALLDEIAPKEIKGP